MVGDAYGVSLVAHVSKAELDQLDLDRAEFERANSVVPPGEEWVDNIRDQCVLHIDSDDDETALQTEPDVKPTGIRSDTNTDTSTEDNDAEQGKGGRDDVEGEPEVTNDDVYSCFNATLFFD